MTQSASSSAHPEGLSMLEKRTIEAEILKEVYETLKESHGVEVAKKTVSESVRRSAIEQARQFAAAAPGGSSLKAFVDVMPLWTKGGALEIDIKEQTDTTFTFNVTRCRYAETSRRWAWARSEPCCRATATAPSAKATTPSSSSNGRRPSCRAPAIATSSTRMRSRVRLF